MKKNIERYFTGHLLVVLVLMLTVDGYGQGFKELEIFKEQYPKAGYFRVSEFVIRRDYKDKADKYAEWRDRFSDLSGIMGKTEYEELLRNNPHDQIRNWFTRYKKDFPDKFVVVHMNGRGRIPNYRIEKFSPGHWVYFEGADVETNLPGEQSLDYEKEVWIEVAHPDRFRVDNGSNKTTKDDITLVRRNKDGTFDWSHAEYVKLLEKKGNSIKIQRAMFGSKPLKFSKGNTYAAPHMGDGPWGETANMPWHYNFSAECPKDKKGNTCADILLEELTDNFKKGGRWGSFDGVQFDVMMSEPTTGYHPERRKLGQRADINMDGKQDDGIINGMQTYGLGVFDFLTRLRKAVGPDKIIAADGRNIGSQQTGNKALSGIEIEGFPAQRPYGFAHWSTPVNLLNFWRGVTQAPHFNYAAMRYDNPDKLDKKDLMAHYRLAFAGSVFTDAFILANSWTTLQGIPDLHEVFQLPKNEKATGWLGKPIGAAVHWAGTNQDLYKDLLGGRGTPFKPGLLQPAKDVPFLHVATNETNSSASVEPNGTLKLVPAKEAAQFSAVIKNLPFENKQLYIEFKMRSGKIDPHYPQGYLRSVSLILNGVKLPKQLTNIVKINSDWFTYRVYFANTYDTMFKKAIEYNHKGEKALDLEFVIHDNYGAVELSDLKINNGPEVIYREFEHGKVFANLSEKDFQWTEPRVVIPAKDALFIKH
jgi:hypothetical protein